MFLKWMLLILIVVIIETTMAKMRLFRILDYLATSFFSPIMRSAEQMVVASIPTHMNP